MSTTQLPSLSQILHKGAPGGHEFAHIVRMLFEAEEKSRGDFKVKNFDDCSGDVDGADAFIYQGGRLIRVQIKFYPSPFKKEHRRQIVKDFMKVKPVIKEDEEWMLLTPDGLHAKDLKWFSEEFGNNATHKGEAYLLELFFKQPQIGHHVYPNHSFKKMIIEYETPKSAEAFFQEFIKPSAIIEQLLSNAQPTYYDCKRVFTEEWWEFMGDMYNEYYRDMIKFSRERDRFSGLTNVQVSKIDLSKLPLKPTPTEETDILNILNKDVFHYEINFSKGGQPGYSYSSWVFLNGRWVFFGKIKRIYRAAYRVRYSDETRQLLRLLKCLNGKRLVKDKTAAEIRLMTSEIVRELKKGGT